MTKPQLQKLIAHLVYGAIDMIDQGGKPLEVMNWYRLRHSETLKAVYGSKVGDRVRIELCDVLRRLEPDFCRSYKREVEILRHYFYRLSVNLPLEIRQKKSL